ncbi:MAG: Gfo/Idh/MocA family oxidoreductase [Candidatus Aminicenantes bacterium]|nr:Gfo/Idh/MocA family oxidoreductase [Candidatus Aminicenantes bacterium]
MTAKSPVSVGLVGIGGMGFYYLKSLLEDFSPGEIELVGVVDPYPEACGLFSRLRPQNIPVFSTVGSLYEKIPYIDLVVIASPIACHVPQACAALEQGSFVLCEKPIGALIQDADRLIRTKNQCGRWVNIGYQWSYSQAIQSLKRDILRGDFGAPVKGKTLCFWPRGFEYYKRCAWAGRQRNNNGDWVLDSPANNAMAHFLHNLFYLLGSETGTSAQPVEMTAEIYRAYSIENYDTVACRAITAEGYEVLFFASHVSAAEKGPIFRLDFEKAAVFFDVSEGGITARYQTGKTKTYDSPDDDPHMLKLFTSVKGVRKSGEILCGPEAARSQTLCVNGIQESVEDIVVFPKSKVVMEKDRSWVNGLGEVFYEAYDKGILPSETGCSWAKQGRPVSLKNYTFFPGGHPQGGKKSEKIRNRSLE